MSFDLFVSDIAYGEKINEKYTCRGQNISPPIKWKDAPASTKEFVLFIDDPDAPLKSFNHWAICNILPSIHELHENVESVEKTMEGWIQLKNSFKAFGYGGPCPPLGTHRYFVTLYALVRPLIEVERADREAMRKICEEIMVKKATWMFVYGKK